MIVIKVPLSGTFEEDGISKIDGVVEIRFRNLSVFAMWIFNQIIDIETPELLADELIRLNHKWLEEEELREIKYKGEPS